jgi:riboflavin transporter FmnP
VFVLTTGLIYRRQRTYKGAATGAVLGAAAMAAVGFVSNIFLVYPVYFKFMPRDVILGMYRTILPAVQELWQALLIFNVPFTFVKGLLCASVALLLWGNKTLRRAASGV